MKKFLVLAFVLAVAGTTTTGFAQSSQGHSLDVSIPAVMMIRMTNGDNSAVTNPGGVSFTATATDGDYSGTVAPAFSGSVWTDIKVFVNRTGNWQVTVGTDNDEFPWSKISNSGQTPDGATEYNFYLPENTTAQLFASTQRTNGWKSLLINPLGYSLTLDGTEDDGDFSTTVTYTITSP